MRYITGVALIFFASMVQSADFQKGLDAYNKGDFKMAYKEWYQLAEQGDSVTQQPRCHVLQRSWREPRL